MKEVIKGTLPNRKDVLRPAKNQKPTPPTPPADGLIVEGTNLPKPKTRKLKAHTEVEAQTEHTLVETIQTIGKSGIMGKTPTPTPLQLLAFVLLIPAAVLAIPGFLILLLADYFKKD